MRQPNELWNIKYGNVYWKTLRIGLNFHKNIPKDTLCLKNAKNNPKEKCEPLIYPHTFQNIFFLKKTFSIQFQVKQQKQKRIIEEEQPQHTWINGTRAIQHYSVFCLLCLLFHLMKYVCTHVYIKIQKGNLINCVSSAVFPSLQQRTTFSCHFFIKCCSSTEAVENLMVMMQ